MADVNPEEKEVEIEEKELERKKYNRRSSRMPWTVAGMLIANLVMIYMTANDKKEALKPSLLITSLLTWAASFIPGIRWLSIVISLSVFFFTFVTRGSVLLEAYVNADKNKTASTPNSGNGGTTV